MWALWKRELPGDWKRGPPCRRVGRWEVWGEISQCGVGWASGRLVIEGVLALWLHARDQRLRPGERGESAHGWVWVERGPGWAKARGSSPHGKSLGREVMYGWAHYYFQS